MSTVKVSLAEPAARWVDEQVATGRYKDADAYLAELLSATARRRSVIPRSRPPSTRGWRAATAA